VPRRRSVAAPRAFLDTERDAGLLRSLGVEAEQLNDELRGRAREAV
jgi:hypothetical protein